MVQFISVVQAILLAGKQLQQLHIEEDNVNKRVQSGTVHSVLLKKLILTASSSGIIANAAKLLSTLNKEAADKGDLPNLFIISSGEFPEVCLKCSSSQCNALLSTYTFRSLFCTSHHTMNRLLKQGLWFNQQRRNWIY